MIKRNKIIFRILRKKTFLLHSMQDSTILICFFPRGTKHTNLGDIIWHTHCYIINRLMIPFIDRRIDMLNAWLSESFNTWWNDTRLWGNVFESVCIISYWIVLANVYDCHNNYYNDGDTTTTLLMIKSCHWEISENSKCTFNV